MAKNEELAAGVVVRDLRFCNYGYGVIEPEDHLPANVYHPILWNVRWDHPGLDNEYMSANELEVIHDRARSENPPHFR